MSYLVPSSFRPSFFFYLTSLHPSFCLPPLPLFLSILSFLSTYSFLSFLFSHLISSHLLSHSLFLFVCQLFYFLICLFVHFSLIFIFVSLSAFVPSPRTHVLTMPLLPLLLFLSHIVRIPVTYIIFLLLYNKINRTCPPDYLYYNLPCPWLQVKCLRYLQFYKVE